LERLETRLVVMLMAKSQVVIDGMDRMRKLCELHVYGVQKTVRHVCEKVNTGAELRKRYDVLRIALTSLYKVEHAIMPDACIPPQSLIQRSVIQGLPSDVFQPLKRPL